MPIFLFIGSGDDRVILWREHCLGDCVSTLIEEEKAKGDGNKLKKQDPWLGSFMLHWRNGCSLCWGVISGTHQMLECGPQLCCVTWCVLVGASPAWSHLWCLQIYSVTDSSGKLSLDSWWHFQPRDDEQLEYPLSVFPYLCPLSTSHSLLQSPTTCYFLLPV